MTKTASHREGVWKQSNKVHKTGQHRSKGAVKNSINGKVGKSGGGGAKNKKITKMARKNAALALRTKKENEAIRAYRPTHMIMFPLGQERGWILEFFEKFQFFLTKIGIRPRIRPQNPLIPPKSPNSPEIPKLPPKSPNTPNHLKSIPKLRKIIMYTKCLPIVAK